MKRILFVIIGIALLVVTVAQVKAMRQSRPVAAPPTAAAPAQISAEGRLVAYPGAEVTVGSDVAGTIERLPVTENQKVRKGELIAAIRADDTRAALAVARARVAEAQADIRLYELERDRAQNLWDTAVGSRQTWEKSERDLDSARARRASAVAEVNRLEALLAKTVITSPIDGVIIARFVQPGETISAGDHLVTVADLTRTRIEAEVDEFDAGRVVLGRAVRISAEGFDRSWSGRIEEVPDSVSTRQLKPQDPSKPIDARVLLVKVALTEPAPLKLRQRVEVAIATR